MEQLSTFPDLVGPTSGNQLKIMSKEIVDLRTDFEKARDAKVEETCERFKYLMTMDRATACRVMKFIAQESGVTYLTIRRRLIKAGAYTPNK